MNADWIELLKVLEILLIAALKFLFAPFEAYRQDFTYLQSLVITTSSGLIGMLLFTYVGDIIAFRWRIFTRRLTPPLHLTAIGNEERKRKIFTRRNKIIVRMKIKHGLGGIAFLTPCIISIPIGTFVANSFFRKKRKTFLYLLTSLLFWSLVLNSFAFYVIPILKENLQHYW